MSSHSQDRPVGQGGAALSGKGASAATASASGASATGASASGANSITGSAAGAGGAGAALGRVTALTVWGWTARSLVVLLFVLAAWGKVRDPMTFAQEIRAYRIAPVELTNGLAFTLPWVELATALVLALGPWRTEARRLIVLMLVVFTGLKIYAYASGMQINCGCFGGMLGWLEKALQGFNGIVLNFVLLAACVLDGYAVSKRRAGHC